MDDIDDYSEHAEEVLLGLRSAVGDADEKILKLQRELDLLESKANDGYDFASPVEGNKSDVSDMEDDDLSKYLEEYSQNTVDDSILTSLRSSASFDANAPTKLFETTGDDSPERHQASTPRSLTMNHHTPKSSKTPTEDSSTMKENTMLAGQENDQVEERWGCLKQVLSEDRSGSSARNEMFKQILEATGKHPIQPRRKLEPTKRDNLALPSSVQPTPKYRSPYDGMFGISRDTLNETSRIPKQRNKFVPHESQHFRPICSDPPSSKSEKSHAKSEQLKKVKIENERLQNLLENEKKKNDKCREKISTLEADVDELHARMELSTYEESTGKISEVVEEIQLAQKIREKAMIDRLQVAARDRDDAIMRAKAIHMKHQHSKHGDKLQEKGDKTLMDLVEKIAMADSARIIEKYGNELVERMNNLKNARARITAEEMAVVIGERDEAVAKCHALRQELQNCVEELNNLKRSQNISVNTALKDKVLSTRDECQQKEAKLNSAEEEIQMLRIYYSLHKSLTLAQDKELNEKYNEYVEKIRDDAIHRAEQAKQVEKENHELHDKLLATSQENQNMQKENVKLKQDFQNLKTEHGKLERLVKILRRKLTIQSHEPSLPKEAA